MKLLAGRLSFSRSSVVGGVFVFLVCFYSWTLAVLLLSMYVTYRYLAAKFSNTYVNSRLLLAVITLFTHTAVLGLVVIILSVFSSVSLHVALCIELIFFCILSSYEVLIQSDRESPKRQTIASADYISLCVAAITFLLLGVLPLANLSTQKQHGNVLALITGNVDYGAHLAIFDDYLGLGTVRTWDTGQPARSESGGFYPTSWHAANAAIANAALPSLRPGSLGTALFGFINVFWISILAFFSARLAFTLYGISGRKKGVTAYGGMFLLSLVVVYFFDIHIMRFGFFSFTSQLIAILLLIYSLHQLLDEGVGRKSGAGLAILYCSISLAAWILLLPVALMAVVITFAVTYSVHNSSRKDLSRDIVGNWPLYLLATTSALAQSLLMVTVKSVSTVSLGHGLLMDGGVPIYDTLVYILLFAGTVAAIFYSRNGNSRSTSNLYRPTFFAAASTLVFASFIFAYQAYHTGTTHYYYYKSLMLIPALMSPLAIAMAGIMISRLKDTVLAVLVAIVVPVALIQLVPHDKGAAVFIHGSRTVSANVNDDVWTEMHHDVYPTKQVTIYFVDSGSNETSTIATLLVQANRPYSQCFTDLNKGITFMSLDSALKKFATQLPASCDDYDVTFKISKSYASVVGKQGTRKYNVEFIHG